MAPFTQQEDSITSVSYSTKGSTPTPISSITTIPSTFSTPTATPTYISKGSPTPTNTSLRGSDPPSTTAIQGSTLAFIFIIALLLGSALGILAWKKGWGYRNTAVVPLQLGKPPVLQRQDSNVTLVNESSLRGHRRERTVTLGVSELQSLGGERGRRVKRSEVQVPEKSFGGVAAS